jgi:hypothetical protein
VRRLPDCFHLSEDGIQLFDMLRLALKYFGNAVRPTEG